MKKLLSVLLSIVMLVTMLGGVGITANAAIVNDSQKYSDTTNYKKLTIYGKNHYKYAFDALSKVNTYRKSAGVNPLVMDKDMLDAAMLRAHELVAHYGIDRANGEDFDTILDENSNQLYYMLVCKSNNANMASDIGDYFINNDYYDILIDSLMSSAGVGCFESEETKNTYWVIFVSPNEAQNVVSKSEYDASKSKSESVALYKDYWKTWNSSHTHTSNGKATAKTTKATKSANGKVVTTYTCKTCAAKYTKTTKTIYKPTTYTLSTSTYTYNGSAKKPSVTVKDSKGNKLKSGTDYTVTYPSGRKNVGKYTIKITFKGNYSGTATKTFTIKPKNTSLSSVSAGKKKFTVKWKKYTTQTTGYQIQYSTDKNFKKN
ncbi:MAG: hypothetical protein NC397_09960, partial [Clostridium sp.]|nr:hypothetical protein [Clostridium sp.]